MCPDDCTRRIYRANPCQLSVTQICQIRKGSVFTAYSILILSTRLR